MIETEGKYYTDERNVQIVISLLKANGIRKIVASPGTTNITFVGSVQQDPWFEIYSSVDERSAAYIACGLSAESGEPVSGQAGRQSDVYLHSVRAVQYSDVYRGGWL